MKYTLIKKKFVLSLVSDLIKISQALVIIVNMEGTTFGFDEAVSRAEMILKAYNQEVDNG